MSDRLTICGRVVGTCTGWDEIGELTHAYYNVVPYGTVTIPCGDWSVDYANGWITVGEDEKKYDLVTVLSHVDR